MIIQRSNNIHNEIHNFKIIHGSEINHFKNDKYCIPTISKDVKVVMISNVKHSSFFVDHYINSDKDNKYILYLDTSDTVLVSDILDPKSLLDKYNCKVLFNAEDNYSYPGHPCDPKLWLSNYPNYYQNKGKVMDKNKLALSKKMNTNGFTRSLNAGVFLGEREFLIEVLQNILDLMLDDPSKGYPYGESDDQILWQHMMSIYENNEIEIDYYNLFFLWTHPRKFDFLPDHWEHFNYFNRIN